MHFNLSHHPPSLAHHRPHLRPSQLPKLSSEPYQAKDLLVMQFIIAFTDFAFFIAIKLGQSGSEVDWD